MSDMDDNPFRAPESDLWVEGVLSGTRDDLRSVAAYQRWVTLCILVYLCVIIGRIVTVVNRIAIPPVLEFGLAIALLVAVLSGMIFVFLLSAKVYGTVQGILLAFCTLIPCIGLLVLLRINAKATNVLRANGIKVGLLGANPANI